MEYYKKGAMISLLSKKPYPSKRGLSPSLFLFALLLAFLLLFDIAITFLELIPLYERMFLHIVILTLSILFFVFFFWRETGGDFFSFVNIVLIKYLLMFTVPILILLYFPQARNKQTYWDIAKVEYSILLVIISLYSLVFGYKVASRFRGHITFPSTIRPSVRRMGAIVLILIACSLLHYIVKSAAMGISIMKFAGFHVRGDITTGREYGRGIYTIIDFLNKGVPFIFLFCFILPRDRKIKKGLILCANLFILFYILNAFATGYRMTTKARVFDVIFICCAFLHYTKKKIQFTKLILIFLLGLSVLTIFNYCRIPDIYRPEEESPLSIMGRMYTQTFEDFETLCVVTSYFPSIQDYYSGRRLFEEIFFLPIPRAIWTSKPIAYGFRAILYDIEPSFFESGYHTGLHSQFYADFGLAGVIIGFFVFGWLIGLVYHIFTHNMFNKGILMLYIVIVLNSWLYFKGGFPWLNLFIIIYIPLYLIIRYIYPYPAGMKTAL